MIELGITRWVKSLRYCSSFEAIMHNLISFNQLSGSYQEDTEEDLLTEYYECLIDCDDDQHVCKRICKEVLV